MSKKIVPPKTAAPPPPTQMAPRPPADEESDKTESKSKTATLTKNPPPVPVSVKSATAGSARALVNNNTAKSSLQAKTNDSLKHSRGGSLNITLSKTNSANFVAVDDPDEEEKTKPPPVPKKTEKTIRLCFFLKVIIIITINKLNLKKNQNKNTTTALPASESKNGPKFPWEKSKSLDHESKKETEKQKQNQNQNQGPLKVPPPAPKAPSSQGGANKPRQPPPTKPGAAKKDMTRFRSSSAGAPKIEVNSGQGNSQEEEEEEEEKEKNSYSGKKMASMDANVGSAHVRASSYGLSVTDMMNPAASSQSERTLIPIKTKPPPPKERYSGKYGKNIELISGEIGSGRCTDQVGTLVLLPSRLGNGWIYAKSGMYQLTIDEKLDREEKQESTNPLIRNRQDKKNGQKIKEGSPCLFDSNDGKFAKNIRPINRVLEETLAECLNEDKTMTLYDASYFVFETKFDDKSNSLQNELMAFDKYEVSDLVERSEHAINAFVNGDGGTIFIGIDKEKNIKGVKLTKVEVDNFKERLEGRVAQFQPQTQNLGSKLVIGFIPVVQLDGTFLENLVIIKITIPGPQFLFCFFANIKKKKF
ncbi:hypothetical protein RFI_12876 [Reticulomyxa filosa]|uniref:Schlafen AlbA-2 domain-containing protein n=1 Tax=Reticulomyxa filosa TaxID=46433 RepID=X6NE81_RETFI|nr:hypothetical protein RFI_12876 [Reticulomyxa filosa]|eukprot:ETO24281.1 hypothetical protein RFI_12876 [Reticulomyxa filosa]